MTDRPEQPAYRITIAVSPDHVPTIIRLRRFLTMAWRGYKAKALKVEEVPTEGSPAPVVEDLADK
jgi:hypothetical protein